MNFRKFLRHRLAALSLLLITLVSGLAVLAPVVTRFSYEEQNISARLETPSAIHWMGEGGGG